MELHGTEGSLGIDRASSTILLVRPGGVPEVIDTVPEIAVNQFAEYAFPGVRERADGTASVQPGLDDGWRVQLFTDAAALSAQRGSWVDLSELNPESD
jgi:predicted dehydrogenase